MIQLTLRDVLVLSAGLAGLDGTRVNGELKPFKLSGTVRVLIGRWNAAARKEIALYQAARDALIGQMAAGNKNAEGYVTVPADKIEEFKAEEARMLDQLITFNDPLKPIFRDALIGPDADPNAIPGTVLGALEPILSDGPETAAPVKAD